MTELDRRRASDPNAVPTIRLESAFHRHYFKAGACDPHVVDFGSLGYTLVGL
jgi:hypothetical protein